MEDDQSWLREQVRSLRQENEGLRNQVAASIRELQKIRDENNKEIDELNMRVVMLECSINELRLDIDGT